MPLTPGDKEDYIHKMENRIRFLENSILFILLNTNLHEIRQAQLLRMLDFSHAYGGEALYHALVDDLDEKEMHLGPEEIDDEVLRVNTESLQKKMFAYKRYGNLNL